MRTPWAAALVGIACSGGVEPAEVKALAERVDHLQRRLDGLERQRAELEQRATPAAIPVEPAPPSGEALTIHLGPAGVDIDGRGIAAAELDAELRRLAEGRTSARVLVEADETIEHAKMVELIDRIRAAGFERLAIASKGGKREPEPAGEAEATSMANPTAR